MYVPLEHLIRGRIIPAPGHPGARLRSLRLAVRTLPSHGGNRGSNPLGSTRQTKDPPCAGLFVCLVLACGGFGALVRSEASDEAPALIGQAPNDRFHHQPSLKLPPIAEFERPQSAISGRPQSRCLIPFGLRLTIRGRAYVAWSQGIN